MRVFLDANILFSASMPKSRIGFLVRIAKQKATLLTNLYAAEEARRNLEFKSATSLPSFEQLLKECELVSERIAPIIIELALKDVPILGGAIAGNASHLLTGDERDFGMLFGKTVQGVTIVSPYLFGIELVKKKWMK